MHTFSYQVQTSYTDTGDGPWTTVAKTIDEHTAEVLSFALHHDQKRTTRVRCGSRVLSLLVIDESVRFGRPSDGWPSTTKKKRKG